MGICSKHTCVFKDDEGCRYCFAENKTIEKYNDDVELTKVLKQKTILFNSKQKASFIKNDFIKCSTCPAKIHKSIKGLYGIHWGHYFDKSIYWYYMFHKLNGAPQCYECNVDKFGNKDLLLDFLIKLHGANVMTQFIEEVNNWYIKQKQKPVPESITLNFLKSIKI